MKNAIKKFRVETAVSELCKKPCFFWSFTTADVVDYYEVASRWRNLRHWIREKFPEFRYIQNFEVHPQGHGWHIHLICDFFLDICNKAIYNKIQSFGFGRINVERVYSQGINDYLAKHIFKAYKGLPDRDGRIRLVNLSRNLECPLKRFRPVFGLTDKWAKIGQSKGHFSEKVLLATFGEVNKKC